MKENLEKEMRDKVEKEMREKLEKELKDKDKKLKNLANNQVTNNFGKIIKRIDNVKHENTQSKIKPKKIGKQSGTTYCFGCKDYSKKLGHKK